MRRYKIVVLATLIAACSVTSACGKKVSGDKKENVEKKSVTDELNSAMGEVNKVKQRKDLGNIKFSDKFYLNIPKAEDVKTLSTFRMESKKRVSTDELQKIQQELIKNNFSDIYTKEEMESFGDTFLTPLNKYPEGENVKKDDMKSRLFSYKKYKEDIEKGKVEFTCFSFSNKKGFAETWSWGTNFSRGKAAQLDGCETAYMYIPTTEHDIKKYIPTGYQYDGKEEYQLLDKKTSVKDAVAVTEDYLEHKHNNGKNQNPELKPAVISVKVVDMGKGIYDYSMAVTKKYKGVRIEANKMRFGDETLGGDKTSNKGKVLDLFPATASKIESQYIDGLISYATDFDIKDEKSYDQMITFEKAVELMRDSFAKQSVLTIKYAELVYLNSQTKKEKENVNDIKSGVTPKWKFQIGNQTDELTYCVYVDVLDGSVDYIVQQDTD